MANWAIQTRPSTIFCIEEEKAAQDLQLSYKSFTHLPMSKGKNSFSSEHYEMLKTVDMIRCSTECVKSLLDTRRPFIGLYFDPRYFNCQYWMKTYAQEMFNYYHMITTWRILIDNPCIPLLNAFNASEPMKFIRPNLDLKSFPGGVFDFRINTPEDIYSTLESRGNKINLEDKILIAPAQIIKSEHRFIMYGNNIISSFQYRSQGMPCFYSTIKDEITDYVQSLRLDFPIPFYAVDIAEDKYGRYKILEFNCFNCTGIPYDIDKVFNYIDKVLTYDH